MPEHTYATRKDVTLTPAASDDNFGLMWYIQLGHIAIGIIHFDQMSNVDTVSRIIDEALATSNAEAEAYLVAI